MIDTPSLRQEARSVNTILLWSNRDEAD